MASLPPQHRSSPRATSDSAPSQNLNRTNSEAFSATSEDSQTLFLNSRSEFSPQATEEAQEISHTRPSEPPQPDAEPRRCWICFNDETEDDENASEWRSPCPCVLVAHEKCLLDWIADMEAPSGRRRAGGREGRIQCPQCKSEIRLERPRSLVVDLIRLVERGTGMMILPGFIVVVSTAAYSTASILGTQTIYQIFGARDAVEILRPLYEPPDALEDWSIIRALRHLRQHWRLDIGLPLIPTVLIASRSEVADSVMPFLPLIFFVSSGGPQDDVLQFSWPPSAAFTVAALPFVRAMYNLYYERVWLPREQRWLKEIQPRAGTEDVNQNQGDLNNRIQEIIEDDDTEDEGVIDAVEVEVDFDIFADWNNGGRADRNDAPENPPVPIARGPAAPPIDAPPLPDNEAAPGPEVPIQQPRARRHIRRERNVQFSTTSLADTILGALVFPSIAAAIGEAFKYTLPKSWVTPPTTGKPTGFLQARWGRSILGGCLFVGVKDAVLLYVRWKMAQNHRKRRVLDYDRSKGKEKERVDRPEGRREMARI
ncbi:hypothetical protein CC78DRAFT_530413 [Lojkania enalia]|uniref:RING-CH-type domain-containing protein n=1 Tax=Lojkania enalia TaxID=147567 RepID=A0A9P4N679_9PLEO|nr:hypothetical protein CC78DRAFT_530413 [Didymosphaeria enalia]